MDEQTANPITPHSYFLRRTKFISSSYDGSSSISSYACA